MLARVRERDAHGRARTRARPFPAPWVRRNSVRGEPLGAAPSCCARRLRRALRCALAVAAGAGLAWGAPVHAQTRGTVPEVSVVAGDNPPIIREGWGVAFRLRREYESDAAARLEMAVSLVITEDGDMLAAGEAGTRQVTFPAHADAVSFTVATVDDDLPESYTYVQATLQPAPGRYTIDSSRQSAEIGVNPCCDLPTVDLRAATSAAEGSPIQVKVVRDTDYDLWTVVTVRVSQMGDVLQEGEAGERRVRMPPNAFDTMVSLATKPGSVAGSDGSVTVTLVEHRNYHQGTGAAVTVTLVDPPVVTLTTQRTRLTEGNRIGYTLTRDPVVSHETVITLTVSETATVLQAGQTGERQVTIFANTGSTTRYLETTDDDVDGANGVVTAAVLAGTGYTVGDPAAFTVQVDDDDELHQVRLTLKNSIGTIRVGNSENQMLPEEVDPVVVVSRLGGSLDEPLDVMFTYARRPSSIPQMLGLPLATEVTVTIPAGQESTDHTIARLDDECVIRGAQDYFVYLTPGTGYRLEEESDEDELGIQVVENDVIAAGVRAVADEVIESDGKARFVIHLYGCHTGNNFGESHNAFPIAITVTQEGEFLGDRVPSVVDFRYRRNSVQTRTVRVPLDNDQLEETDGTVTLAIAPGANYVADPELGSATVIVRDDDETPEVNVTADRRTVPEDRAASFTLVRDGTARDALAVGVEVAHRDQGVTTTSSPTVTFAAGAHAASLTVAPADDRFFEQDDAVTVTLTEPAEPIYRLGNTMRQTVTVLDNDPRPFLQPAGARAPESAGSLEFAVEVRHAQAVRPDLWPVTVTYATENGTAEAGVDYTAVEGALTFHRGGAGVHTVAVTVAADQDAEVPETFSLRFSEPEGVLLTGAARTTFAATGTIVDYLEEVSIRAHPDYGSSVREGLAALVQVRRHGVASAPLTVDLELSFEGEYRADAATRMFVAFEPDVATKVIAVETLNDAADEPDGALLVKIAADSFAGSIRGDPSLRMTITDDDPPPRVELRQVNGSTAYERGGPLRFEAALSFLPGHRTRRTVTVDYSTADAGATAGADYTAAAGTLTFAPGVVRRRIGVALLDDDVVESDETLQVSLANASQATLKPGRTTATGTIRDDDALPQVGIAVHPDIAAGSIAEGSAARFRLTRTGAASASLSVRVQQSFQGNYVTAAAPADSVVFAAGEAERVVTVATADDDTDEDDGAVRVAIVVPPEAPYRAAATSAATVTVTDDDPLATLTSKVEGRTEAASVASVDIGYDGRTERTITVGYATGDGTASAGSDYVATSGTVTLGPGSPGVEVNVSLLDDDVDEDDETFTFSLSEPTNAYLPPSLGSRTITIWDDDHLSAVEIAWDAGLGDEAWEGFLGGVLLTRDGSTGQALAVRLAATFQGGYSATWNDADLATLDRFEVEIPAGESELRVLFDMTDNDRDQSDGWLTVAVRYPFPVPTYRLGAANSVRVPIRDNDLPPELTVRPVDGASGPEHGPPLAFEVALLGETDHAVTVSYASVDGTAQAGADYRGVAGTLRFAPGETVRTIAVDLLDDETAESEERFSIRLSSPVNGRLTAAGRSATGVISGDDDHLPTVTISAPPAVEEGARAMYTLRRSGSSAKELLVTVEHSFDGAFGEGSRSTRRMDKGVMSLSLTTVDDQEDEADGAVTIAVIAGDGYRLGSPSVATVAIRDNDPAPGLVIRHLGDGTVTEDAGPAAFEIAFAADAGATARPVSVDYTVVSGTAAAGSDFTAADGQVTLPSGVRATTISVPIVADDEYEADETFMVRLRNPVNAVLADDPVQRSVTVTIDDDDAPVVSIRDSSFSEARAAAERMPFTVTLDRPSRYHVTVDYATSTDGAPTPHATPGSDFTSRSGSLAFRPGVTRQTILVSVRSDSAEEGHEHFTIALSNPVRAALGTATATGQIIDWRQTLTIAARDGSVVEGADAIFDFARAVQDAEVGEVGPWNLSVDIAQSGAFLAAAPGAVEVTIPSGQLRASLTVATVDDDVDEAAGAITATVLDGSATATVQVRDNDTPIVTVSGPERIVEGEAAAFELSTGRAVPVELIVHVNVGGHVKMFTPETLAQAKLTSFDVRLPAGAGSAALTVTTANDHLNEGDGEVVLTVRNSSRYRVGGTGEARVLVKDDDIPEITLRLDSSEGGDRWRADSLADHAQRRLEHCDPRATACREPHPLRGAFGPPAPTSQDAHANS